jgi:hypothetical protein
MTDNFAELNGFNLLTHGDAREQDLWPTVASALSNYELFWRNLIVLLTNRIERGISFGGSEWIQARATIPSEYERLAMHNYSLFYFAARARQAIYEDRQRLASGNYPHPEIVFFTLQACVEHAKALHGLAESILHDLGVGWTLPNQPEDLYQTIGLYRNALTHDPLLGRAIDQGREWLPRKRWLPKMGEEFLLWRDTAPIPMDEMIDLLDLEEQHWTEISAFLQKHWGALTMAFVKARECDKFITDLGLIDLLPIRCTTPNITLWTNTTSGTTSAASGCISLPAQSNAPPKKPSQ